MFRINNCSSSGGLYKQLAVFYRESLWGLVADTIRSIVSATRIPTKMHGEIMQAAFTDLLMMKNYLFETYRG